MDTTLIAVALIAVVGSSLPTVLTGMVNRRAAGRAEMAARLAQQASAKAELGIQAAKEDAAKAQADAAKAQGAAAEAAAELVRAARVTGRQLDEISKTGKRTHTLVNSQHTLLLRQMADLWARVVRENPDDEDAKRRLAAAERAASNAQDVQDVQDVQDDDGQPST